MPAISDRCHTCGTHGPVAALATLGDGRQLALCRACADRRDGVRAFVAQFNGARRDDVPVARATATAPARA